MSETKRILIVGPSWVGDMVMAQSLFIALKNRDPDCRIDVLAPAWSRPLLARMPEVSGAIDMPVGHGAVNLKVRRKIGRDLRTNGYHQAILLPNSFKSALIPWFAAVPVRTGWRGEMRFGVLNDIRLLDKDRYPLMVERFVALACEPGAPLEKPLPRPALLAETERVPELRQRFGLESTRPVLVLCPGAEFGPAKRWPETHFAAVAADRIDAGWQVWLLGSAKDNEVAQAIIDTLPDPDRKHAINLAGRTELADAIDLMSQADAVVSNDSGLMHIAAALNRPLVVVYGSTSPKFTPPLNDRVEIAQIPVDCGPCFQRECPQGHLKCLNDLAPERVISGLDRLTDSSG